MKDIRRVSDGYDFHLDRREVVVFSLLFLLCFFLFFLLGVLYGRRLNDVVPAGPQTVVRSEAPAAAKVKEEDLGEGEKTAADQEAERRRREARARAAAAKPPKPEATPAKDDLSEAPIFSKEEGEEFEEEAAPAPTPRRVAEARPISAGEAKYTIQVASFKDKAEAEAHADRLSAKGYDAFITSADLGDRGVWYRVRVGRYAERDEANRQMKAIKEAEKIDAYVAPLK